MQAYRHTKEIKLKISGLIITFNEEKNIEQCIRSLFEVCDEVIVIDSLSTDKTVELAQKAGAKTYLQKFLGDGPQRNYGLQYCKNDWVLNLDADERLELDAIEAIKSLDLTNTSHDAFELKRKNLYQGEWIKCCGWYPDYIRRLFNRKKTRFRDVAIHTKIESNKIKKLNGHILHNAYDNASELIRKIDAYSTVFAQTSSQKSSPSKAFAHAFFSFIKNYFFQKGFLCGYQGLLISISNANGVFYKYIKLYEKSLKEKA